MIHFVNIFIRVELIENVGLVQAGYWEVAQKLTDGYNQIFGTVLTYMVLPYFTRSVGNLVSVFGKVYLVLLGVVASLYLFFSGFGELVIALLFSKDAVVAKKYTIVACGKRCFSCCIYRHTVRDVGIAPYENICWF